MNCPHCGYGLGRADNLLEMLRNLDRSPYSTRVDGLAVVQCSACLTLIAIRDHLSPEGVTPVLEAVK